MTRDDVPTKLVLVESKNREAISFYPEDFKKEMAKLANTLVAKVSLSH